MLATKPVARTPSAQPADVLSPKKKQIKKPENPGMVSLTITLGPFIKGAHTSPSPLTTLQVAPDTHQSCGRISELSPTPLQPVRLNPVHLRELRTPFTLLIPSSAPSADAVLSATGPRVTPRTNREHHVPEVAANTAVAPVPLGQLARHDTRNASGYPPGGPWSRSFTK